MADNSQISVPWPDLLPELVESIGKFLDTEIDVLRFRAVCRLWRSSRPPLKRFPCGGVVLPHPFRPDTSDGSSYFTLVERIVYRIELPDRGLPNFWLLKVERLGDDRLRILNPTSHLPIQILPEIQMRKELNALDYRVSEVSKAYALKCVNSPVFMINGEYSDAKKVVYRKGIVDSDYFVMAIDRHNKLWYIMSGDDRWTLVPSNDRSDTYVDIVGLRGGIFGIDDWGRIWGFNSKFEPQMFADSTLHDSLDRHLVESFDGKKLHLVEKVAGVMNICSYSGGGNTVTSYLLSKAVLTFRIWELNRREREWTGADPWNGLIIFVGDDCSFSISSKEFDGHNGYRLFYTNKYISFETQEEMGPPRPVDLECNCCPNCQNVVRAYKFFDISSEVKLKFRGLQGHNTGVCDFVTNRTGSLLLHNDFADIFWPPPSWLSSP